MRARWLKPEFFTDRKIASMAPMTALIYQALWCWADDGGTAQCDPDLLKAQVFYRWSAVTVPGISEALQELAALGRVYVYAVGDEHFAKIRQWEKHQAVHKPSKFRYPPPPKGVSGNGAAPLPESPGTGAEIPTARILESHSPRILESQTASSSSARETLSDVDRLLTGLPDDTVRMSWKAEIAAARVGMHGPSLTDEQVGRACRDYVGNGNLQPGKAPSLRHFRAFLRDASKPPKAGDAAPFASMTAADVDAHTRSGR